MDGFTSGRSGWRHAHNNRSPRPTDPDPSSLFPTPSTHRKGKRTLLCQAGVEVQSAGDKIKTGALVAVFGALVVGGVVASFLYEPLQ